MPRRQRAVFAELLTALLLVASTLSTMAAPENVPAAPDACGELIQNGGFESGSANWMQEGGAGVQLITTSNARTGQYSAQLGGQGNVNHRVSQQFNVPNGRIVTLRFWREQWTQETTPSAQDYLAVNVLNASGALLTELIRLGVNPNRPPWEQLSLSLATYAGQTVQLQFQGVNDAINPTDFFVDDVSVTSCTAKRTYLPLIRRQALLERTNKIGT